MKVRATKSSGSIACNRPGAFELMIHMEADPNVESFAEFSFDTILPRRLAAHLSRIPAFFLRHRAGEFVVCAHSERMHSSSALAVALDQADGLLAETGIWLMTTTPAQLRREPKWTQAQELARCAGSAIHPDDRQRVIEFLDRCGPTPVSVCARLCKLADDSLDAIYGLVASGAVYIAVDDAPLPSRRILLTPPVSPSDVAYHGTHDPITTPQLW